MVLLMLCLACVPVLPGMCVLKIIYGKRSETGIHPISAYITGWMICIGLAGVSNVVAVVTGQSLLSCAKIFLGLIAVVEVVAGLLLGIISMVKYKNGRSKPIHMQSADADAGGSSEKTVWSMGLVVVFLILILVQIGNMIKNGYVYIAGDMTLETVQSFLDMDALYQVNPLTGQAYEAGVPLRVKILCLPTLYAILCRLFDISAKTMVWTIMPVYHLICAYMVYFLLAKRLFERRTVQQYLFLVLVALILWQGTYAYGMDGLGLLYRGFRGESVRGLILLPFVVWAGLERKWLCILLAVLAEACIVWTLYGMGACLFVGVILSLVLLWCGHRAEKHGKEGALCGK